MSTKTKSTALTVIDPKSYAVLDPNAESVAMVGSNLAGESISEFDLDQVKTPSGGVTIWTVPTITGEENVDSIEGIIVHVAKRRQYWASTDPSGQPPDCHSRDMLRGIGNPGGDCEQCPHNEFGSSKKGGGGSGRGKACKETRAVFLVRPTDNLPIVVNFSPGSLKNLKQYLLKLPAPYFQVITRLTLEKQKNADGIAYAQIRPTMVERLPAESVDRIREYAVALQKTFA